MRPTLFFVVFHVMCLHLPPCASKDVSCVFEESCVLPCSFTPGEDPVLHWTKEEAPVYNYYKGQPQLHLQHEVYRGRTSLSDPGVQTGNASLQLHRVTVRDEGRYTCYVTTISSDDVTDSYINIGVYAPVLRLSLQKEEEQLICSSDNIYPRPAVTWTFRPGPTDPQTSIRPSQTGLFSVLSSVPLIQRPPLEYTCNISTEHSWRSATYRRNLPIISTDSEVTIHCAPNYSSSITSLVWTFSLTQTIVNQTGSELVYSESWKQSVHVSQSGDLRLQGLTKQLEGLFSCELTTDRQTYSVHTQLIISEGDLLIALIVGLCIGVLALIAVVFAVTQTHRNALKKLKKQQLNGALNAGQAVDGAATYNAKTDEVRVEMIPQTSGSEETKLLNPTEVKPEEDSKHDVEKGDEGQDGAVGENN